MLLAATFLTIIAIFAVSKAYVGDDRRFPPASTPRGREARLVMGTVLVVAFVVMLLNFVGRKESGGLTAAWLLTSVIAIGLPIFRYIRMKNKRK